VLLAIEQQFESGALDQIIQTSCNTKTTTRLMKRQGSPPKRLITDKLRSYAIARRQAMPSVEHRSRKGLNNHTENSHLPLRRQERAMQGVRRRYHINGECCPVLVNEKLAPREINDLGRAEAELDGQPYGYTQLMWHPRAAKYDISF
jgi:hypothetical protein